ncbi:MAG: bifunctional diaminohydroxyphosphoribosylaminopyrimidine deaminase/5-amino-6-(5-phosphoribosylamino)uracil reductase RibD [Cytophagales bacterium]|nr:bifunctional diaminohydroxyphosphoribosylaminopyrimidine deaminase/5-amino-6-(5-phosphoribosylamino)uracil reductase RibD [Cytophagales bacterium]
MTAEEKYMRRALELATLGIGHVSPNPLVGCVLVQDGRIIGEGWHAEYGQAHAEVRAINSVSDHDLLPDSTLYVNLEPCSHFGNTPPCMDLILEKKIPRVVVANRDPNPLVAGQGIKLLREAGVEVITGVLEEDGRFLNRRFFHFMEKERPYIVLKWAQTRDGYMARENYDSKWISSDLSRVLVHKWRAEEDAVLVGRQTAHSDNPRLDVRLWQGRNPVRLVIDRHVSLSAHLHLFDGSIPTLCFNLVKSRKGKNVDYIKLEREETFLAELLAELYRRKIQSVLVEGGSLILNAFIQQGYWNEARIFSAPLEFGAGIKIPALAGVTLEDKTIDRDRLRLVYNSFAT